MVINMSAEKEMEPVGDGGLALEEAQPKVQKAKPEVKPPPLYKVVMLNDDYSPMEFVIEVLEGFFYMDRAQATEVMWKVHTQGKAICGVFTYDIAETKVSQVIDCARRNEYPLLCTLEAQ